MKNRLLALLWVGLLAGSSSVWAAGYSGPLDRARVDVSDQGSLQRGAHLFFNYCMGCHSLEHMRYNRVARDLGLTEAQVVDSFIFLTDEDGEKVGPGSLMVNAMPEVYGAEAFGRAPPDLTMVSRVRGNDWLYTFLRSFYLDDKRPLGVNNTVYSNVGMPHVLWELQGWQSKSVADDGSTRLQLVESGQLSGPEYDKAIRDLVGFLSYIGEPVQLQRQRLGIYVMLFLLVFTGLAYLLKKEYWRDIH
jgi:ubiquinol-cytochrome c reductase cytochrome c1 subunit